MSDTENSSGDSLADVGEKGYLRKLLPQLPVGTGLLNGFGHDAAIVDLETGSDDVLVMKIDRAAHPVATSRGWCDYKLWGRLAVTTCASDILAVGGTPKSLLLSLILPRSFRVHDADMIVAGCLESCLEHGITLVGGDTKEGRAAEVVAAAIGVVSRSQAIGRHGSLPGDYLVLVGELGGFEGAHSLLTDEGIDRPGDGNQELIDYLAYPHAKTEIAANLLRLPGIVAGMDLSDGLYDAANVLRGEFGAVIYSSSLPLHQFALKYASLKRFDPTDLAFGVGDWAILYILRSHSLEEAERLVNRVPGAEIIGHISDTPGVWMKTRQEVRAAKPIINEHFVRRMEDNPDLFSNKHRRMTGGNNE